MLHGLGLRTMKRERGRREEINLGHLKKRGGGV
jgi:hypothetical protein